MERRKTILALSFSKTEISFVPFFIPDEAAAIFVETSLNYYDQFLDSVGKVFTNNFFKLNRNKEVPEFWLLKGNDILVSQGFSPASSLFDFLHNPLAYNQSISASALPIIQPKKTTFSKKN